MKSTFDILIRTHAGIAAIALTVLVSGCSDNNGGGGGANGVGDMSHSAAAAPPGTPIAIGDGGADPNAITAGNPIAPPATTGGMATDDPMSRGMSDPLAGSSGGFDGGSDTASSHEIASKKSLTNDRLVKNWYWIRGSIYGGRVNVTINHLSVGTFSSHVDKEITDRLRPGFNEVDFEQIPTTSHMPVRAHLEVVYSQQATGSLPALTYDTQQMAKQESMLAPADTDKTPAAALDWRHTADANAKTYSRRTDTMSFNAS